jgi:hypothetical protein
VPSARRGELLGVLQALADRIAASERRRSRAWIRLSAASQERLGRIETTLIDVAQKLDA